MTNRWDSVNTADGEMRCYVSAPEEGGPHPAVIVIQHAGGVDDFVRGRADRLAEAGFVAIAPDLYYREEPGTSDDPMTRMMRLRDRKIVPDVKGAVDHVQSLAEVDGERIGITGYCMGGRVTYLMCASDKRFKAGVVCWGGNIMVPWGRDDPSPFDLTEKIGAPILGLFGEEDPNPSPADVAKIDAELTRLGKAHEFHSYAGAGHAFMNEGRPSYREEAAVDAWKRCIAWFDQHLKG
jgi:carboxymethylenebutenolidase